MNHQPKKIGRIRLFGARPGAVLLHERIESIDIERWLLFGHEGSSTIVVEENGGMISGGVINSNFNSGTRRKLVDSRSDERKNPTAFRRAATESGPRSAGSTDTLTRALSKSGLMSTS